jgi:hypothetical protein
MVVAGAKDKALIGAAGVFHVAAELSLRGMIALPTIRNTAGYDLIVTSRDGLGRANIQVKTSGQHPNFWPICWGINSVKSGEDDYYILLRRNLANDAFEGFMLIGPEMKDRLAKYDSWYTVRGTERKFSLCIDLDKEGKDAERWQKEWKNWKLA